MEAIRVNGKVNGEESPKRPVEEPVNPTDNPHKPPVDLYEKLTERFTSEVLFLQQELEKRDETINRLINTQSEERQRTDTIIMKLTNDVGNLQKLIEHKNKEKEDRISEVFQKTIPPVQPWQPKAYKNPMEGLGFFERLWVQIMEPQKLRQAEY